MSQMIVDRIRLEDEHVVRRSLVDTATLLSEDAVSGIFREPEDRTEAQRAALFLSDAFVEELEAARAVVIGTPIYNFGPPASLKAWADLVARRGRTFRYGESGPVGLIENKPVHVAIASGGTRVGSDIDFLSGWLRHFLGFIGLHDVHVFDARRSSPDDIETLKTALAGL